MLIKMIIFALILLLVLFLCSACILSGRCSRAEELVNKDGDNYE